MYLGTLAMLLAYLIRFPGQRIRIEFALVIAIAPFVWLGVFSAFGLYGLRRLAPAEEFRRLVWAVAVATTAITLISFWSKSSLSRVWVGLTWLLATVLLLSGRKVWHRVTGQMRGDGRLAFRTLIVGANGEVDRLIEALAGPESGFRVVACVATAAGTPEVASVRPDSALPVIGDVSRIREAIQETRADSIFLASSSVTPEEAAEVTKAARQEGVEVHVSSSLPVVVSTRLTLQPIGDVMALSLRPVELSGRQAALKRGFDVVLSLVTLVVLAPVLVGIVLAIKLSSRGPVLFKQLRVGRHGKQFMMLKFRTMLKGAESMLRDVAHLNEASGALFKIHNDPRVTRVGRWLRRWSLDELPQLFNVVRGDMSLVGPRPALPDEVAQYEEWHRGRLEIAPGVTGLWQVNGRADVEFDQYVRLDLFYIENWSLTYDLFILMKTIPALVSKKGAY
jgi:exopolysaccharide biosynthesis polyprenyl glycosylphosphotransferase